MELWFNFISKSKYNSGIIERGYKSIRKFLLDVLDQSKKIIIIAGSTGTGKTQILHRMNSLGYQTIDL